jgi:hypothetical protein
VFHFVKPNRKKAVIHAAQDSAPRRPGSLWGWDDHQGFGLVQVFSRASKSGFASVPQDRRSREWDRLYYLQPKSIENHQDLLP